MEAFAEEAAELQSADTDGTGVIDEMELRNFIAAKKREGVLAPGVGVRVRVRVRVRLRLRVRVSLTLTLTLTLT